MLMGRVASLLVASAIAFLFLLPGTQAGAADAPPELEADSYLVMDAATGQVLAEKNAGQAQYPASITKILTIGLVLEAIQGSESTLDERVEASRRACDELIAGASTIGLAAGDALTLRELLYATQIESANDAANVLAEFIGGSLEGFADKMNAKAAELGLTGSHFTNPSGQPDDAHYTSAGDMAKITRWALSVPGFKEIFAATQYDVGASESRAAFTLRLHNSIMLPGNRYYYEGITGSKMGYTDLAMYTLVTTAQRDGTELICVVLACSTNEVKYEASRQLLDYCFASYSPAVYPASAFDAGAVPVLGGGDEPLGEVTLKGQDVSFLLHEGLTLDDVTVSYSVPENYVIGQDFTPTATLSVARPDYETVLVTVPLTWTGVDEILAANTGIIAQMARQYPVTFWFVVAALAVTVQVIVLRSIHLRHRRNKRRAAKLAAARAHLPINIGGRPPPPQTGRRSPGPVMAYAGGAYAAGPRRTARAEICVNETSKNGKRRPFTATQDNPRRVGQAR